MRQGPNNRRPRGGRHHSGNGSSGGNNGNSAVPHQGGGGNRPRSAASLRHQSFDSNCNDVRVRGNAWQVHEKYQALARDATTSGDRVAAENFLQHAEHYFRVIEAINEATALEQQHQPPQGQQGQQGQRSRPPQHYSQQPEVPQNYYGTDAPQAAQQPAQASPPSTYTEDKPPFFSPEETDDHDSSPAIAGAR